MATEDRFTIYSEARRIMIKEQVWRGLWQSGRGSADGGWWRMDCELRIVDCGLRSGTEDRGLMGVGGGFIWKEGNHRLQVKGWVVKGKVN